MFLDSPDPQLSPLLRRRRSAGNRNDNGKRRDSGLTLNLPSTAAVSSDSSSSSISSSTSSSRSSSSAPSASSSTRSNESVISSPPSSPPRRPTPLHHDSDHVGVDTYIENDAIPVPGLRKMPSTYCFCAKCVPPTPTRTSMALSQDQQVGPLPIYYDPTDINAKAPIDPWDSSLTARVLYASVYAAAFALRWCTLIASLALPVLAYACYARWGSAGVWGLPVPLTFATLVAGAEVFLSLMLVYPHRLALDRFFDQPNLYPHSDSGARWHALTEAVHAFHPYAGPLAKDKERAPYPLAASPYASATAAHPSVSTSTGRALLRASRPLPSASGQPYYIVPHVGTFLSGWFFGANPCDIKHDNLKEWFAWAFFNVNVAEMNLDEERELDEMVDYVEEETGITLAKGYNPEVKCIKLNLDEKRVKWRGGLFYTFMTLLNLSIILLFRLLGYTNIYSPDGDMILHVPSSFARRSTSTSSTKKPVLFMHGLGVGMVPYLPWALYTYWTTSRPVIFLHVPCVSIRLFPSRPPSPTSLNHFLQSTWATYRIPRATMVGHSLGTSLASWAIKDPDTMAHVVDSAVLVDPISFGLCFFDVAHNFVYKTPQTWTQLFIRYFAGRDPNVSNYLYRHFWWFENVIWKSQWKVLDGIVDTAIPAASAADPRVAAPATPVVAGDVSRRGGLTKRKSSRQLRRKRSSSALTTPTLALAEPATQSTLAFPPRSSAPPSATNPTGRLAIFLSEFDSIVNSEVVKRYLEREQEHSFTVFGGIGHGGFLYTLSTWAQVRNAVQRTARNAGASVEEIGVVGLVDDVDKGTKDEEVCLR
ncbi:hypothetical protein BCR44DRAFT_50288 [Catenaria anguillulae PL171]|uniref:AB hydrolase-1 domain-containing protein n=1 Tax=Catenaria anguillulae PL171 TaxID=765915 RepID=A0A1Y2HTP3_9FUNG|nr:hypothetical protein BCR44DRAFT_50288 [Catenaria anguillulae PL171]